MTGANSEEAGAAGLFAHQKRNLAAILLGGAAGAGVVLLATRQELARVVTHAPRPLPDAVTTVTAQSLRPGIAALALAALASLAAVIATRGLLRRITGLITIALGAGVALSAMAGITTAAVLAAAGRAGSSPASGGGAGTAAGSVTAGNGGSAATGSIAGFPMHVVLGGTGWRLLMLAGALLIVAAGVAVVVLAGRLPVMSGRYERQRAASGQQSPRPARPRPAAASMWESLSAGRDPTATGSD